MDELKAQLAAHLPPIFPGAELDRLTENAIRWRTIQNIRSSKEISESKRIPNGCFLRDGKRKILIVRDQFLKWWFSQLEPV